MGRDVRALRLLAIAKAQAAHVKLFRHVESEEEVVVWVLRFVVAWTSQNMLFVSDKRCEKRDKKSIVVGRITLAKRRKSEIRTACLPSRTINDVTEEKERKGLCSWVSSPDIL